MYNFNGVKNLSELKELCFYIKAINECGEVEFSASHVKNIQNYLKEQYNLEISVSKLYLFVDKIKSLTNNSSFPKVDEISSINESYVSYVRKNLSSAEIEVYKAELNLKDSKLYVGKNKYKSTKELADDISIKRSLWNKNNNVLIIWSFVISLFISTSTYCVVGLLWPTLFARFLNNIEEIVFIFSSIFILAIILYLILYSTNRKKMENWRKSVKNYYKHEFTIKKDIELYNQAKQNLYNLQNQFSINGIELTDEMMMNFLSNTDDLDIKYYSEKLKLKKSKENFGKNKSNNINSFSQVISRYEQNKQWKDSYFAKLEKININKEIVSRINSLANYLESKGLSNVELANTISALYCKDFSVSARKDKIDRANSKIELSKIYLTLIEKIKEFEALNIFEPAKLTGEAKTILLATQEEKHSFYESLNMIIKRIDKANALGLLTTGQSKSYEKLRNQIDDGVFQGIEIGGISYRYDLAKIYIRLYDELSLYDVLN